MRECAEMMTEYQRVEECRGSGDMGRDVIGYPDKDDSDTWDNYQCKHFRERLAPHKVYVEIGKLVYYAHSGIYTWPRKYYFVAPLGVGTDLSNLLRKPSELKKAVIAHWDTHCRDKITKKKKHGVLLAGNLRKFLDAADFKVFNYKHPHELLALHELRSDHLLRFGGVLSLAPVAGKPPPEIDQAFESRYVEQLIEAYRDHLTLATLTVDSMHQCKDHIQRHFISSRQDFYSAELLRVFARNNLGVELFESLKEELFKAVVDVHDKTYPDGLERLRETTQEAIRAQIDTNPLTVCWKVDHRKGLCHRLANEDRLTWVRK